jgi:prolyl oligopeptidase
VTTPDHDNRVFPAHSFKFVAALQEKNRGENPVLIRVETRTGPGSNEATNTVDETADRYAFFLYNVGAKVRYR